MDQTNDLSKEEIEKIQTLQALTDSLIKRRDEAVAYRAASGIERRWRLDEQLFDGSLDDGANKISMLDYATGEAPARVSGQPNRSMVEVNVVRNKCETSEGRFSDIMLPTDGKNWGLKVTPKPDLIKATKNNQPVKLKSTKQKLTNKDGSPITMSEVAKNDLIKAKEAMKAMETEIDDQLNECNYNGELRKVIKAASRLGTGIIKGPNVVKKIKKSYRKQILESGETYIFEAYEEHKPASQEVSCWNLFPDPDTTEDVKKTMSYIFENDNIRPKELFDLIGIDGYMEDQIKIILSEKPKRISCDLDKKSSKYKITQSLANYGELYEMWIFSGDLNRDDLEILGVDLSTAPEAFTLSAVVVMVNDKPIKVMLNPLDAGDLPYDFFQWTQVSGSPWGIGLPRMMLWLQRIINAAMRAMMDNAGDSAGVNVIIGGDITPVDNVWELTGKKLWKYAGSEDPNEIDVRKMFAQFQVANNQQELQNIIELAFKLLDLETGIPMIFQGEQQRIPETLGATNIMVDASNVALRARIKLFDDCITRPHLTKYYYWNMEYNDNNEIKGDFCVDARGTSVLLQKNNQTQTLTQIMQYKNDPDFALRVNWDKAIKDLFDNLGLDVINDDQTVEDKKAKLAQQPQAKDPKITAAEIRAQSEMEALKAKNQLTMQELQFKAAEADKDRQHEYQMKLLDRDIKMMEFAEKRQISLDSVKGKLTESTMKLQTQVALTDSSGKAPQVTTPAFEPPERAPAGEAFTK